MKPFALVLVVTAVALAGCSAQPLPAKTVTTTVTATPAPVPRAASDSLTKLDAWLACSAAVRHEFDQGESAGDSEPAWNAYDEKYIAEKGDAWEVTISFPAGDGSAMNVCTASGTVGNPTLTFSGFTDI